MANYQAAKSAWIEREAGDTTAIGRPVSGLVRRDRGTSWTIGRDRGLEV